MEKKMSRIDYMKVLDTVALTLETSSNIELHSQDLKHYSAVLTFEDGTKLDIQMKVDDFDIELELPKKIMPEKEYKNWLIKFEFQLEQIFLKNITLINSETKKEYKLKIQF
jgi:hypothetical protein